MPNQIATRLSTAVGWLSKYATDQRVWPVLLSAFVIFGIDVALPLGVASGVLHVAVVLLSLRSNSKRLVTATAVLCSVLTLSDMFFSAGPGSTEWWKVIVNRGLSLLVIWVTAILGQQRNRAAEAQRRHLADLAHISRVKTVECLAGALAHELNQPLTAIALHAEVISRELTQATNLNLPVADLAKSFVAPSLPTPDDFRDGNAVDRQLLQPALHEIVEQSHRASHIVRSLRSLIRRSDPMRQQVMISELLNESLRLIEPSAREARVELVPNIPLHIPPVHVDHIQIEQVILNLLQNGIDSLSRHHDTTADSSTPSLPPVIEITAAVPRPGWVCIAVTDNGPGIDPQIRDSLFEPFTTKKTQGFGLGLAISRSIAEAHSGRLSWDETATRTTFILELPST